jgi:hypothetical protein
MSGESGMTIETRIVFFATPELDRDDVELRMPVLASRLGVDVHSSDCIAPSYDCVHLSGLI